MTPTDSCGFSGEESLSDSDSDSSWVEKNEDSGDLLRDEVSGVFIPPKKSSTSTLSAAHKAHLQAVLGRASQLSTPPPPPVELVHVVDKLVTLQPAQVLSHREDILGRIRLLGIQLNSATEVELLGCRPEVQSVLRGASKRGVHIALLRHLLEATQWGDLAVVDHLLSGFPLAGPIPVVHLASPKLVRSPTLSLRDRTQRAGS